MKKISTSLQIKTLELNLHLGWSAQERAKKQKVFLDVEITFPSTPKACDTDDLEDTVCYDELCTQLQKYLSTKKFRLVEYLAQVIYTFIKTSLPKNSQLAVAITKNPKIKNLRDGVSFRYGDT